MLLTGTYRRSLDDKLRLAIPKPLREQLPAVQPLYLAPGLDGCLALYPQAAFETLAGRLDSGSPAAEEVRSYSRLFFSQAAPIVLDAQWRFRASAELVRWAGIATDVTIVGVRDHLEIWSTEKWNCYVAERDGQYEQLAEMAFCPGRPAADDRTARGGGDARNPADAPPAVPR